jgi:Uncharacterized protein conserved in bacteria
MKFEYDPHKSQSNKLKHGLDFEEVQTLWADERHLVIPAQFRDEMRLAAIGRIGDAMWTAVFTMRGETVRLISCRRSRREEVLIYEQE